MRIVIAGGHGKIALQLTALLDQRGDQVRSLIRNPEHADDVREAGATEATVCDLEQADGDRVAEAIGGADAIVFAAGAGPGSGVERKETMDHGGAVKLIEAAKQNGIGRYVIVSSIGADPDHEGDGPFDVYRRAKGRADRALAESGLDFAIVRPGALTDEPGTGTVTAGEQVEQGEIPRRDVAAVLAAVVQGPGRRSFEVVGGATPIEAAIEALGARTGSRT